jgi:hypothetical protein
MIFLRTGWFQVKKKHFINSLWKIKRKEREKNKKIIKHQQDGNKKKTSEYTYDSVVIEFLNDITYIWLTLNRAWKKY